MKVFTGTILLMLLQINLQAQHEPNKNYRNFPIILTIQFHSLSLPFKDLKSNFSNVGVGLGTEVSFNGKQDWVQQFQLGWIKNISVGNRFLFYTQTVYRPTIVSNTYAEIKAGIGYAVAYRPIESYIRKDDNWIPAGHKGKGMLMIPVGVSLGYQEYKDDFYMSPFISYQLVALKGYNKSIPFVPERLIQIGSRMHVKY